MAGATVELQFKLTGLEQLQKKMAGLSVDIEKKAVRYAGARAAKVVKDAAVANAQALDDPATAENISKNITSRFAPRMSRRGNVAFRIGVLGGARQYAETHENKRKGRAGKTYKTLGSSSNPGGDTWYWRLVHFGTSHSRAQPFLTDAASASAEPASNEFISSLDSWLDKYFRRSGAHPPGV